MFISTPDNCCPECSAVIVRAGTMCAVCDHDNMYGSPIRTSPPLKIAASAVSLPQETGSLEPRARRRRFFAALRISR